MLENDIKLFFEATGIPVCCFKQKEIVTKYDHNQQDFNLPLFLLTCIQQEMPKVWYSFTPEYMYFGGIYNKETGQTLFLGPVLITECSLKQAETICLRLGRSGKDSFIIKQCFDNTRPHSVNELLAGLHLLCRLLQWDFPDNVPCLLFQWDTPYPIRAVQLPLSVSDTVFSDTEDKIMSCIQAGNVMELNRILNEQIMFSSDYMPLSLNDQRVCILGANMLASRSAIQAGLDYQFAWELCCQYISSILKARTSDEISYIFLRLFQDYTQKVANLNSLTGSPIVRKIYQYIQLHFDSPITLRILADYLHMNCSYLSSLFKKETGITLSTYIQQEKIREARRLLKGSKFTITQISEALAFSSQSYFCAVFKKITGMTPESYRHSVE